MVNTVQNLKLAHFITPNIGSAGEHMLLMAVKQTFEALHGPVEWTDYNLRTRTKVRDILKINLSSQGAVIGGGGLFLRDTNPNRYSGWQWKCPRYSLRLLRKPLIMYAIGYNRFRGQPEFDDTFIKHVSLCLEKASFVGLRSHGSIRAVTNLVGEELGQRIRFQPCPSIFYKTTQRMEREPMTLAVVLALDREKFRFQEYKQQSIERICMALVRLEEMGWRILITRHHPLDESWEQEAMYRLQRPELVDLRFASADEIAQYYQRISLVVGMRGHGQLIPFGQGCRIISLISQEKMWWFLEDIGMPELGIEVLDDDLEEKLVGLVQTLCSRSNWEEQLVETRRRLWEITLGNHEIIATALGIPFERKPANIDILS